MLFESGFWLDFHFAEHAYSTLSNYFSSTLSDRRVLLRNQITNPWLCIFVAYMYTFNTLIPHINSIIIVTFDSHGWLSLAANPSWLLAVCNEVRRGTRTHAHRETWLTALSTATTDIPKTWCADCMVYAERRSAAVPNPCYYLSLF